MTAQLKNLCFTLNNPTIMMDDFIMIISNNLEVEYLVIGEEVGESGTRHFQGFIMLKKKTRFKKIHDTLFHAHIEPLRGTAIQASDYCKKDGMFKELGQIKDVVSLAQHNTEKWKELLSLAQGDQLDAIQTKYPGEYIRYHRALLQVRVEAMKASDGEKYCLWLWGEPGTGKSRFAKDFDNEAYWKNPNKWWDNFDNTKHKTVIIDDFDKTHKCLGYHIKRFADRYPVLAETKGSSIYANYDTLIITSNYSIEEIWEDDKTLSAAIKRRFHEYKVMGFEESLEGILSIKTYNPHNLLSLDIINKFNLKN